LDKVKKNWSVSEHPFLSLVSQAGYGPAPNTETATSFEALVVKWNNPFHESDFVVVNATSQSRNP